MDSYSKYSKSGFYEEDGKIIYVYIHDVTAHVYDINWSGFGYPWAEPVKASIDANNNLVYTLPISTEPNESEELRVGQEYDGSTIRIFADFSATYDFTDGSAVDQKTCTGLPCQIAQYGPHFTGGTVTATLPGSLKEGTEDRQCTLYKTNIFSIGYNSVTGETVRFNVCSGHDADKLEFLRCTVNESNGKVSRAYVDDKLDAIPPRFFLLRVDKFDPEDPDGSKREEIAEEKKTLEEAIAFEEVEAPESEVTLEDADLGWPVEIEVHHNHDGVLRKLVVEGGLEVKQQRKGAPASLDFTAINAENLDRGDSITVKVRKKDWFFGYIFKITPKANGRTSVTVYDQLRYLKNKDARLYKKWTTTKLVKEITKDFHLNSGALQDTKYPVTRSEIDVTLFDMIQNSLEETQQTTGRLYTLYDEAGKIRLREPWSVNWLVSADTAMDYEYSASIDGDTYNQIKLGYENEKSGTLDTYIVKDTKSQNEWGTLQYYEKLDRPDNAELKAKLLLKIYNKEGKTLSVSDVFGCLAVKAGCIVPVVLNLYDTTVSQYMLVDKVTHKFKDGRHLMDLSLSGGDFLSDQ